VIVFQYESSYTISMKTAISIPDRLFRAAEREAARRKVSRSRLYAMAVDTYLKSYRASRIKEALDAVYAREDSALDPVLDRMQNETLGPEDW
jgi:antitoxin MazE6